MTLLISSPLGQHRRMTLEAFADVDAGRVVDDKVVRAWAASSGEEKVKKG